MLLMLVPHLELCNRLGLLMNFACVLDDKKSSTKGDAAWRGRLRFELIPSARCMERMPRSPWRHTHASTCFSPRPCRRPRCAAPSFRQPVVMLVHLHSLRACLRVVKDLVQDSGARRCFQPLCYPGHRDPTGTQRVYKICLAPTVTARKAQRLAPNQV